MRYFISKSSYKINRTTRRVFENLLKSSATKQFLSFLICSPAHATLYLLRRAKISRRKPRTLLRWNIDEEKVSKTRSFFKYSKFLKIQMLGVKKGQKDLYFIVFIPKGLKVLSSWVYLCSPTSKVLGLELLIIDINFVKIIPLSKTMI